MFIIFGLKTLFRAWKRLRSLRSQDICRQSRDEVVRRLLQERLSVNWERIRRWLDNGEEVVNDQDTPVPLQFFNVDSTVYNEVLAGRMTLPKLTVRGSLLDSQTLARVLRLNA